MYFGQCAEFCGTSHSLMRMRLVAHTGRPGTTSGWPTRRAPRWSRAPGDSAVALGKQLVTTGACAACHYHRGHDHEHAHGAALTHFGRRRTLAAGILDNNAENLRRWLTNPPEVEPGSKMPPMGEHVGGSLTDQQITYIIAYLQSLQ